MSKTFRRVGGAKVGRSVFNLSYEKKLTCDMGQLIPVMVDEVVPGDVLQIGNEVVIRFQPLVAPILHEINCYTHYFFVPNRILWDDWESFITGGVDGTEAPTLPKWAVTSTVEGSLWDYMGFPLGANGQGAAPVDFPKRAYNMIYNEYYRDETLISEINIETSEDVKVRCWEKDYFTSALPWQQRGTAPALPISGVVDIDAKTGFPTWDTGTQQFNLKTANTSNGALWSGTATSTSDMSWDDPKLEVDLSNATTFDIADLRLAFQIQRWLERNARAGARYTEFLRSHFGVAPRDERLDRPEYIGGSKSPVIISEVLQTSSTDGTSAQGNLAGHGITVDKEYIGKYRVSEFGVIVGIMSVMPRTAYSQGIDRQWIKRTKYDYYFPEFANLSEQAIERAELYATSITAENTTIFGYQGKYNEMRYKRNMFAGQMRTAFDYWHMGRIFSSAPLLNDQFVNCIPRKDIFAVPSEPGLIVNFGNIIKAIRPMPITAEPGLIDHV